MVRGDPDAPVHARQWYEFPDGEGVHGESWCYTDRLSYAPGEIVLLHGISTASHVDISVCLEGRTPRTVMELTSVAARWADTPQDASVTGCHWPLLMRIETDPQWQSGVYRVDVQSSNDPAEDALAQHLFVLRPATPNPENLLLLTTDCTWNAYNDWGGSNAYEGIGDPLGNRFSPRLSCQRPFARGFVSLPADAPRTLPDTPPIPGGPVTYPHMEWAWENAYSKKYASAGWASYEKPFLHWAERQGYSVDIATQSDLHYRPEVLEGYRAVVIVGHDEYWSWDMRDAVERFMENGGSVARFAGNFFWQVRLDDEGHTQVCYKYRARQEDPMFHGADNRLTTNLWESPEVDRPGHATFGLDGSRGVYAGWGGMAPYGPGGFTLFRPQHWALDGSGLGYGDILGARGRIFGYEVDGLDFEMRQGLPFPVDAPGMPDDLEIIALGFARLREDSPIDNDLTLFVGDDDALFIAEQIHGNTDSETLARVDRGNGMVVSFTRGKGRGFTAGTTEWVTGLIRGDGSVEQVTINVLNRFLAGG